MDNLKDTAQRVLDLYAQELCAFDDPLTKALVELGDHAKDIVDIEQERDEMRAQIIAGTNEILQLQEKIKWLRQDRDDKALRTGGTVVQRLDV